MGALHSYPVGSPFTRGVDCPWSPLLLAFTSRDHRGEREGEGGRDVALGGSITLAHPT